jgi:DUF4097 and DUF4098 domain-containing protein YvlB
MNNNINELLIEKLDQIFSNYRETSETKDLYDEVYINLKETCSDYLESGISEREAIEKSFGDLGDLTELLGDLSGLSVDSSQPIHSSTADSQNDNINSDSLGRDNQDSKPLPKVIFGAFPTRRELVNHVTIPANSIENLSISYSDDSLVVLPSPDHNFHIKEQMNMNNKRLFANWTVEHNTLTIKAGKRPLTVGVNGLRVKTELLIPKNFNHNLTVQMTSGSVKIEELSPLNSLVTQVTSGSQKISEITTDNIKTSATSGTTGLKEVTTKDFKGKATSGTIQFKDITTNDLKASTTSGSIKITDATISNHLDLESTSGTLKVVDSNTNEMKLRTTNSSIKGDVSKVSGTFKTKSGSINLLTRELSGNTEINTTSGSATLKLKNEQKFNFKLRFGSGSAKVKLPRTLINVQKKHLLEGFVGEPAQITVNGETLSGSISIKEM